MNRKLSLTSLISVFGLSIGLITSLNSKETPNLELPSITPVNQEVKDPKEITREESRRAFKKMNDYTFRIFSPCNMGTGWILDYEIPENGSYPKTWYIATNLHVISRYGFSENPYGQKLPTSKEEINRKRYRYRGIDYSKLSLYYDHCKEFEWYGYFDFNLAKEETGEELNSDMGLVAKKQIEEPKLFYAALNFLEEDTENEVNKNNWKDFAVLEIKFKDEEIARKITNNFATKYPVNTKEAINVFSDALEDRYSWDELSKLDQNFYSFAYPKTGDKFKASKTWNEETLEADRLSNDKYNWYHNAGEEKIPGFIAGKRIGRGLQEWGNETFNRIGHLYFLKNFPLGMGSSGAMYVDKDGNLLGLKAVVEIGKHAMHSWVDPIRSKGFTKGGIKTPKYDLILGGDKQLTSYKQQVEKYNKKTFLRERGWKHIS
ncbi:hypothetical protein A6V39_05435 [Candidatus Mycoplasma haematobovis]|uniref:DUF31 domain-containing protein n=1 Tax=Candidatus Mycoplasma haematobovis TaxID=432608 RepID=A0A1A9QCP1_9MOLU|nr:hypothetical protein [Candidatus Mycoplasma haematobovis]OAL09736.1 hypothetical protein A6V39_05435 [Candidatus Mycoplasma haematobovis]